MATFVDHVTLHLRAGDGGNGCVSVKREKFKPLAGPDGGNGGNGGDIVLVSDPQVTTLLGFHRAPHRASDNGGPGMGDHRSGADGGDLVLPVPVGTVVKDADGTQLIDLAEPGMRFVAAPGGRGGLGNAALASPKRKAPGFALLGTPGWEGDIRPRTQGRRRRRARRLPVGREVQPGRGHLRRQAENRRLPVHDPAPEPRRRAGRRHPLHRRRRPRPHRGRQRRQGSRPRVPPPRRALHGAGARARLRHAGARARPDQRPRHHPQAELAAYPVPAGQLPLLERPRLIALNKTDVPEARGAGRTRPARTRGRVGYRVFDISAVSREGLRSCPTRSASWSQRAAPSVPPSPSGRASSCGRAAVDDSRLQGHASKVDRRPTSSASSARSRSGGWRRPTSPTTKPSDSSPIAWRSSASKMRCSNPGPSRGLQS